jgi:hypothetical protein
MGPHPVKKNSQGQSLIEALAVSAAMMTFICVLGVALYFSVVHFGISYLLHEHLVCEETQGANHCREDFLNTSKIFLIAAKIRKFESSSSGRGRTDLIEIQMPFNKILRLQKDMDLYR